MKSRNQGEQREEQTGLHLTFCVCWAHHPDLVCEHNAFDRLTSFYIIKMRVSLPPRVGFFFFLSAGKVFLWEPGCCLSELVPTSLRTCGILPFKWITSSATLAVSKGMCLCKMQEDMQTSLAPSWPPVPHASLIILGFLLCTALTQMGMKFTEDSTFSNPSVHTYHATDRNHPE